MFTAELQNLCMAHGLVAAFVVACLRFVALEEFGIRLGIFGAIAEAAPSRALFPVLSARRCVNFSTVA
jgi:hypothetical protein